MIDVLQFLEGLPPGLLYVAITQESHPALEDIRVRQAIALAVDRQAIVDTLFDGAATLASRVLGYVRDMVVALAFGAGPVTDAFFVAFRIPNILRRLLGEGALSTAVVPVFTEYAATRPAPEFHRMVRAVLSGALLALVVTTVLGVVSAPWLVRVIAPGFAADPAQLDLAALLTRVMFPYLVLVGLAALAMGALHAQGRFFAPFLTPGTYAVRVELSGFSPVERKGVEVRLGQRVSLDFTLKVGQISETALGLLFLKHGREAELPQPVSVQQMRGLNGTSSALAGSE